MDEFPKISIITVVYNAIHTIERTITSVLSQNYPNLEYIVIDGGSNDGTIEILKRYQSGFAFFVSESDNGIYDAMNKGLAVASGEIVGFLNADDFYNKKILLDLANGYLSHKFDYTFGSIDLYDKNNNYIESYMPLSKDIFLTKDTFVMPSPHMSFFITKSMLDKIGIFNLNYRSSADYDFMLRTIKVSRNVWYFPHSVGGYSTIGYSNSYYQYYENYLILKSHHVRFIKRMVFIMTSILKYSVDRHMPKKFVRFLRKWLSSGRFFSISGK